MSKLWRITAGIFLIVVFAFASLGVAIVRGHGNWLPDWAFTAGILSALAVSIYGACQPIYEYGRKRWRREKAPNKFSIVDERFNLPE
jgi:hypothetical protein